MAELAHVFAANLRKFDDFLGIQDRLRRSVSTDWRMAQRTAPATGRQNITFDHLFARPL